MFLVEIYKPTDGSNMSKLFLNHSYFSDVLNVNLQKGTYSMGVIDNNILVNDNLLDIKLDLNQCKSDRLTSLLLSKLRSHHFELLLKVY